MHRQDFTLEDVQYNRRLSKRKRTKPLKLPDDVIWIEDPIWYDGIFCYQASDWTRYSRVAHIPIEKDEMCKWWYIYKVELVKHSNEPFDYDYKILSKRPDVNV